MFRKAFTLMEVNLAILVMAGGLLSSVALFSLGYQESAKSNEDTASAAYADEVLGRLTLALGDVNLKWSDFNGLGSYPSSQCWADYFDSNGDVISGTSGKAAGVFGSVMSKCSKSGVSSGWPTPPDFLKGVGLVVVHDANSPVVKIAFRASRKERQLMSAPLYYTEVLFQGEE